MRSAAAERLIGPAGTILFTSSLNVWRLGPPGTPSTQSNTCSRRRLRVGKARRLRFAAQVIEHNADPLFGRVVLPGLGSPSRSMIAWCLRCVRLPLSRCCLAAAALTFDWYDIGRPEPPITNPVPGPISILLWQREPPPKVIFGLDPSPYRFHVPLPCFHESITREQKKKRRRGVCPPRRTRRPIKRTRRPIRRTRRYAAFRAAARP